MDIKELHQGFLERQSAPARPKGLVSILKVTPTENIQSEDLLSVEEPLEIRIAYGPIGAIEAKSVSVTMRTPGSDGELAAGFLFTEGIISRDMKVSITDRGIFACGEGRENIIQVSVENGEMPDLRQSDRNFYTTSSCGVCGKSSIASIRTVSRFFPDHREELIIPRSVFYALPEKLRAGQQIFAKTGGIHGAGLFTPHGEMILSMEDVGRHNALDKLIGRAFLDGLLPLNEHILLLSGRSSFELIQKAVMAGIRIVAAIGAPSTLAVELAREFEVTLIGFLREKSFNIYSTARRISN